MDLVEGNALVPCGSSLPYVDWSSEIQQNTKMNPDKPIEEQFPCGSFVWHRVSGQKFMVIGHATYIDGTSQIIMNAGEGDRQQMPELLSTENPELNPSQL